MNLSAHFALREFLRSDIAAREGREVIAESWVIDNLARLARDVLEPIRTSFARPVFILSGYRPPWLNSLAKGSKTSDHLFGLAADIEVIGVPNVDVCRRIIELKLPFNQLINEFPPHGWVHVSVAKSGVEPKRQALTAIKRASDTVYLTGIHV